APGEAGGHPLRVLHRRRSRVARGPRALARRVPRRACEADGRTPPQPQPDRAGAGERRGTPPHRRPRVVEALVRGEPAKFPAINARVEGLPTSGAWGPPFKARRALVPATEYFE